MTITADTGLVALLGDPVSHSLSPLIHNTGFEELDLDMAYLAFRIRGGSLGDAVNALKTLDFEGANVTIPHKQEVIFFLDELTERAEAVGAVNTIVCKRAEPDSAARLIGDNTDVTGFLQPLSSFRDRLRGGEALVWGSGGGARAVVYALLEEIHMSKIHLVCRNTERGETLARALDESGERISVSRWDYATLALQKAILLVNATPLGMTPRIDGTPCQHPDLITSDHVVYDLVYNPTRTALLKQADARGAYVIEGLNMLIGQAAQSFEAWTGAQLPIERVRVAIEDARRIDSEKNGDS